MYASEAEAYEEYAAELEFRYATDEYFQRSTRSLFLYAGAAFAAYKALYKRRGLSCNSG